MPGDAAGPAGHTLLEAGRGLEEVGLGQLEVAVFDDRGRQENEQVGLVALLGVAAKRTADEVGVPTVPGSREPIDSVRFIGNRSSGRMGFALAEQASRRGAQVTLIAANVALAGAAVIAVIGAAAIIPAWRATRVDPIRNLRDA